MKKILALYASLIGLSVRSSLATLYVAYTQISYSHLPLAVTTKVIPDLMVRGSDPLPLLSGRVIYW